MLQSYISTSTQQLDKKCCRCKEKKVYTEFHKHKERPDGLSRQCKSCSADYYKQNRGKILPKTQAYDLKRKYGITVEAALELCKSGRCDACGVEAKPLYIDHCHTTKKIRGALCLSCNIALGHVKDDRNRLQALIAYLENST